jgi:hypothetical protein
MAPGPGGCEDGLVERTSRLFPAGRSRGVTVAVDGFSMWLTAAGLASVADTDTDPG